MAVKYDKVKKAEPVPTIDKAKDPSKEKSKGPTFVQKVIREDTYMVLAASQYYPEDEFVGLYFSTQDSSKIFLQPPYMPKQLMYLTTQNNILGQCVEAMEVNIDGTGYELVPIESDEDVEKQNPFDPYAPGGPNDPLNQNKPKLGPDGKPLPGQPAPGVPGQNPFQKGGGQAVAEPGQEQQKLGPDGKPIEEPNADAAVHAVLDETVREEAAGSHDPASQVQQPGQEKPQGQMQHDPGAQQQPGEEPGQDPSQQKPEEQKGEPGAEQPMTPEEQKRKQLMQKAEPWKKKTLPADPANTVNGEPGTKWEGKPPQPQDGQKPAPAPPMPDTPEGRAAQARTAEPTKDPSVSQTSSLAGRGPTTNEPYDKDGKVRNSGTEQPSAPSRPLVEDNQNPGLEPVQNGFNGQQKPLDPKMQAQGGQPSNSGKLAAANQQTPTVGGSSTMGETNSPPGQPPGGPPKLGPDGQPLPPEQGAGGPVGPDGKPILMGEDGKPLKLDENGEPVNPAIEKKHKEEEEEKKRLSAFLDEPYPNKSLVTIRRDLRRDLEQIGWGAIEVLRNVGDEVVGLRNVMAHSLRLVRLDAPVLVKKVVTRNEKEVELQYWDRERRYAIKTGNNQYTYYRDFGSTRQVHRQTGNWETPNEPVKPELRGTELLFFRILPDIETPYGLPRWVNQMPSVLGSRKAEEQNLEFFDAGGLPPAIIFIEGGTLASDMADQLRMYLSGQMKSKNRAVVVEAQSSSGSIDSAGTVKTRVERFGAEATKDAMYAAYDKSTEEHVRVGFRLPPLFIGRSNDYNYASAQVSYMVAEAQVFQPEREEFDEVFNSTVMKALGAKRLKFKSKAITLKDMETQIKALTFAQPVAEGESYIENVNKVTGLTLKFAKQQQQGGPGGDNPLGNATHMDQDGNLIKPAEDPLTGEPTALPKGAIEIPGAKPNPFGGKGNPFQKGFPPGGKGKEEGGGKPNPFEKKKNPFSVAKAEAEPIQTVLKLAQDFCVVEGLVPTKWDFTTYDRDRIRKSVDCLTPGDREMLNRFVGIHVQAAMDSGKML